MVSFSSLKLLSFTDWCDLQIQKPVFLRPASKKKMKPIPLLPNCPYRFYSKKKTCRGCFSNCDAKRPLILGVFQFSSSTLFLCLVCALKLNLHSQMRYMKPLNLLRELYKTNGVKQGRLLGLDVGNKYVGLAISDPENQVAEPLSVLLRKKSTLELMASDFQNLVSELSLAGFIVGYPFDRNRGTQDAVQVKVLIDDLSQTGKLKGVRYTYWDEAFTSKNVDLLLRPLNLHPVLSKTIMDKFAAVNILQGYLDYVNRKLREEE